MVHITLLMLTAHGKAKIPSMQLGSAKCIHSLSVSYIWVLYQWSPTLENFKSHAVWLRIYRNRDRLWQPTGINNHDPRWSPPLFPLRDALNSDKRCFHARKISPFNYIKCLNSIAILNQLRHWFASRYADKQAKTYQYYYSTLNASENYSFDLLWR